MCGAKCNEEMCEIVSLPNKMLHKKKIEELMKTKSYLVRFFFVFYFVRMHICYQLHRCEIANEHQSVWTTQVMPRNRLVYLVPYLASRKFAPILIDRVNRTCYRVSSITIRSFRTNTATRKDKRSANVYWLAVVWLDSKRIDFISLLALEKKKKSFGSICN